MIINERCILYPIMCGRYTFTEPDSLNERYNIHSAAKYTANFNASPTQRMPVIRLEGDEQRLELMRWGLIPSWAKDKNIGYKLFNARSETVFEKPSWRSAIRARRCLIPATGFYEWKREGTSKKQPYYITVKRRAIISFAGIWESWKDENGKQIDTYSILTTTPNKEMSELHDRMPVILHKEDEESWLNEDDRNFLETVMKPYEDGHLKLVPVSTDVNVVKNNNDHLMLPLNSK